MTLKIAQWIIQSLWRLDESSSNSMDPMHLFVTVSDFLLRLFFNFEPAIDISRYSSGLVGLPRLSGTLQNVPWVYYFLCHYLAERVGNRLPHVTHLIDFPTGRASSVCCFTSSSAVTSSIPTYVWKISSISLSRSTRLYFEKIASSVRKDSLYVFVGTKSNSILFRWGKIVLDFSKIIGGEGN